MTTSLHNRMIATEMMDCAMSITMKGLTFEGLTSDQRAKVDKIMEHSVKLKEEVKRFDTELKSEDGEEES